MKRFISLVSIFAILASIFVSPLDASADYQIIGSAVVDDDTEANEVIFGDNFDRGPGSKNTSHGWDINFIASTATDPTASSAHGLAWGYGSKPASSVAYIGTWDFVAKDESAQIKDYYLEIATGSEKGTSTAAHILRIPAGENFTGHNTDGADAYVLEFDLLVGDATSVTLQAHKDNFYTTSYTFLTLCSDNSNSIAKTYNKRFALDKWHHVMLVIDEVSNSWYTYIDNERVDGREPLTDALVSNADTKNIRINIDMPANGKAGIDNVLLRRAGDRTLVFDGEVYSFTADEEADYNDVALASHKVNTSISADTASVVLTKSLINEFSTAKSYKVIMALYNEDGSIQSIYTDPDANSVGANGQYFINRPFALESDVSRIKIFLWDSLDSVTPIVVCDEFIKTAN